MDMQTLNNMPPWEWPDGAGDIIRSVLGEKSAPLADRLLAADMAGNTVVMNDEMAALILAVLRDSGEPEELRCKAAISLGPGLEYGDTMEFDDPDDIVLSEKVFHEVQEQLRDIFQDKNIPKNVRRRVLEAAVRAPADWHEGAIREAYGDNDEEWHLTAVFCMGYVDGFEDEILESLESENPDIVYEAVTAAGTWQIEEAWPFVEELIINRDETDKSLLIAAIIAAPQIRPGEAAELLSAPDLSYPDDEEIAEAVEEAREMMMIMADDFPDDLPDDEDDLF